MKSMKLAFLLCVALLIWATIKVQRCHAVSIDGGRISTLELICAQNPGLNPAQVLQDTIAEGNVVVYIGDESRCPYCVTTMAAMNAVCAEYPDVAFIYLNSKKYNSFRTIRTIPELRLYKNGQLMQTTGSKTPMTLRNLLNSVYKR